MRYPLFAGGMLLVLAAARAAFAQDSPNPSDDGAGATCGEFMAAVRAADPGERPSRERRREAEAAQDALVDAMLWLHGYRSGLAGPDQTPVPLTREWMVEHVRKLAQTCQADSPDGTLRLVEAARRL